MPTKARRRSKATNHITASYPNGKKAKRARAAAGGKTVNAWQDDPASGLPGDVRPVPNLLVAPLKFKFKGKAVPAGAYDPGTAGFRYWAAAEALRRGADFWAPLLAVKSWEPGAVLAVGLDEGVDFNAYYDRTQLAFFHDTAGGKVIYSGESPDVVCHEMGHACLDAHRPELWDAPYVEAGAFHESFGDTSAILSALQLESVRVAVLSGVATNKSTQLSRLAEQLGAAIRTLEPDAVNKDCLRNACNTFKYVDPQTLPDSAPATRLSTEVHSFSRVFTGAFYEILGAMLKLRAKKPTTADLAAVATDYGKLILAGTASAPVQPNYYSLVAAHMLDADTALFAGKYRTALANTFVKRHILSSAVAQPVLALRGKEAAATSRSIAATSSKPAAPMIQKVELNAAEFGLASGKLIVNAPVEHTHIGVASAAMLQMRRSAGPDVYAATHRFVQTLFAHDRVEAAPGARKVSVAKISDARARRRTHVLVESRDGLRLVRRHFDCGHPGCRHGR